MNRWKRGKLAHPRANRHRLVRLPEAALQNSSLLMPKSINLNTRFIVFDTNFNIFDANITFALGALRLRRPSGTLKPNIFQHFSTSNRHFSVKTAHLLLKNGDSLRRRPNRSGSTALCRRTACTAKKEGN